jgi:hypothetical protein
MKERGSPVSSRLPKLLAKPILNQTISRDANREAHPSSTRSEDRIRCFAENGYQNSGANVRQRTDGWDTVHGN